MGDDKNFRIFPILKTNFPLISRIAYHPPKNSHMCEIGGKEKKGVMKVKRMVDKSMIQISSLPVVLLLCRRSKVLRSKRDGYYEC